MLIVALVLAVIGLAALVTAVVTSNEVVAWVCIGASALGVLLLIVDAVRERQGRRAGAAAGAPEIAAIGPDAPGPGTDERDDAATAAVITEEMAVEDHPEEIIDDAPDHDTDDDEDEAEYPAPAEEAAMHVVTEDELADLDDAGDSDPDRR